MKKQRSDEKKCAQDSSNKGSGNWKKKLKKAIKTPDGLAHVMSVMLDAEQRTVPSIQLLQPQNENPPKSPAITLPPAPSNVPPPTSHMSASVSALAQAFPALATKVKLQSILKSSKKE